MIANISLSLSKCLFTSRRLNKYLFCACFGFSLRSSIDHFSSSLAWPDAVHRGDRNASHDYDSGGRLDIFLPFQFYRCDSEDPFGGVLHSLTRTAHSLAPELVG